MSDSMTVSEISALLRLSAEVAELPADPIARRRHALEGLRRILGAAAGVCFERPRHNPRAWAIPDSIIHVGGTREGDAACTRALLNGDAPLPVDPSALRPSPMPYSALRSQLIDDGAWYASDHYRLVMMPMGCNDSLYSCVPLPDGTQLCIGLHRAAGEKPFTQRHCKLVDLFHASCGRLYYVPECEAEAEPAGDDEASADEPDGADREIEALPPRLQAVLKLLLVGDGEKQVAFKLDLSKHTVHTYAKEIYRKLGVSSRGELLAKFIRRSRRPAEPARPPQMAMAS
jgi:DNA-binding CsgD family transcriptional regulator